jgi:hypothetical protein
MIVIEVETEAQSFASNGFDTLSIFGNLIE